MLPPPSPAACGKQDGPLKAMRCWGPARARRPGKCASLDALEQHVTAAVPDRRRGAADREGVPSPAVQPPQMGAEGLGWVLAAFAGVAGEG